MNELAQSLENATGRAPDKLRMAASNWAAFAINNLDDELLRKGLLVSAAIADYLNEYERLES